ncbi:hypothetical protein V8C34DRAFT_268744 [Trichoderma compactum]
MCYAASRGPVAVITWAPKILVICLMGSSVPGDSDTQMQKGSLHEFPEAHGLVGDCSRTKSQWRRQSAMWCPIRGLYHHAPISFASIRSNHPFA